MGVVCVDSGYEIGVGGAAGLDVRHTDLLAKVATEDEAVEIVAAFVQLYREHAKYLDRPYKWITKVGLDWVRARMVDDRDSRAALVARFDHGQSITQTDSWAERAAPRPEQGFSPLADLTLEAAE